MTTTTPKTIQDVDFGIFFFASSVDSLRGNSDPYQLLLESVRFADRHGFSSAWVPERHFTEFGFIYPNPAQVLTGLATVTQQIRLCAGSLVSPLHNIIRIVEEWSVLDNLSRGRIGASFAPGWNPDDFVLFPERYRDRRDENFRNLQLMQRLWKDQKIRARNGVGKEVELTIFPPPHSKEFPAWVTASGSPETFRVAGELGANVLTHLLDQELSALSEKIAIYRQARAAHGHDPESGVITAMIHSFVGEDTDAIREEARAPYCRFLKNNINLAQGLAADRGHRVNVQAMSEQDVDAFLNFLYDRFVFERAFIGSPESCVDLAGKIFASGVDEIACLLDFGPAADRILANLPHLNHLKDLCRALPEADYRRPALGAVRETPTKIRGATKHDAARLVSARDLTELRRQLADDELPGPDFYAELERSSWVVEDTQRGIQAVWRRSGEALGRVHFTGNQTDDDEWPQALLTQCLPLAVAAVPTGGENAAPKPVLPSGFKSFQAKRRPGNLVWVHALAQSGPRSHADEWAVDLQVFDESGNDVATAVGVRLTEQPNLTSGEDVADWLFRERWDLGPLSKDHHAEPGHWLIFADRHGVGEALSALLERAGHSTALIDEPRLAPPYDPDLPAEFDSAKASGACARQLRGLLDRELCNTRLPPSGVVYLWGLDSTPAAQTTPESLMSDQFMAAGSLTLLVQALTATEAIRLPKLWVVTRGAKSLGEAHTSAEPLSLAQAPLWGVGKTCSVEHPEVWGGLVDLDGSSSPQDSAAMLYDSLLVADGEDQVAFRNGERFILRVMRETIAQQRPFQLHSEGAYLITGGLKGFGFEVARWLVGRGARHLVLLGRTELPERSTWAKLGKDHPATELVRNVQALEALGASVHHPPVDVTCEDQVERFVETYRSSNAAPLRGVFHCAAVWTGDKGETAILPLSMTKVSSIGHIFPPKVVGSWLLSRYLKDETLDFFVVFSAAAGLLGSAGQLVYTAANSFMDALVHDMAERSGRPALSINWGPIKEIGSGATDEGRMMHQLAERRGLLGIPPEKAMQALELLIPQPLVQVGVMRTNWELLVQSYVGMLNAPWASELVANLPKVEQEDLVSLLREAEPEARLELLCSAIQRLVVLVMGYSQTELPEVDQGLFDLGLDSLLGLELKNHIQTKIRKEFPATAIFDYPTIQNLSTYLLTDILALPITSTEAQTASEQERDLIHEIDRMSEAEVEARLARQLGQKAAP